MKKCKFFGTDGIRGIIGQDFDSELTERIANATAVYLCRRFANTVSSEATKPNKQKILIGWDTRASCDFIVHILAGKLSYYGCDVIKVGIVPTAALSFLTNRLKADLGIMVSASHCSAKYNGVKFFNKLGEKLSEKDTYEFDKLIEKKAKPQAAGNIGTITEDLKSIKIWQNFLKAKFKPILKGGIKIALDCANGSGAQCAGTVLRALGFDATLFNDKSNGVNINDGCGATKPSYMQSVMKNGGYDIGFAFDGDADRCIVFDEQGHHVHGDIVIYLLAKYFKDCGKLAKNKIAGTILFNLGIEKCLNKIGVTLIRTDVGDTYVYYAIKDNKLTMGGETSGHMNFADIWCTGDGLVMALMILAMLTSSNNKKLSELCSESQLYPNVNINTEAAPSQKKQLFSSAVFKSFVKDCQKKYKDFRIIVRPSGTENIVRITVEGADTKECEKIAGEIAAEIGNILKTA